jgi:hypothetical protein
MHIGELTVVKDSRGDKKRNKKRRKDEFEAGGACMQASTTVSPQGPSSWAACEHHRDGVQKKQKS